MVKSEEVISVIPARGGSKSIPRKNLLDLCGKPLIAWTIEHALSCPSISRVMVSTDDIEIRDLAISYGAEAPFLRPESIAKDESTDLECFQHLTSWLLENEGRLPLYFVHLRATGPVRSVNLTELAIDTIKKHNGVADSLRSVSPAKQSPFKMWMINQSFIEPLLGDQYPESHSLPRQTLPQAYWQNGYVDIVKPSTILKYHSMTGPSVIPFVMNAELAELDYIDDIEKAESLLKQSLEDDIFQIYSELGSPRHAV